MKASQFHLLLAELNKLNDNEKYGTITVADVLRHAEHQTIWPFLVDKYGNKIDLSFIDVGDWSNLHNEWATFAISIYEQQTFGVEKGGVNLLTAYALESIRLRSRDKTG